MLIKSGQEALFVAIEMERGAIQLYERALMLTDTDDDSLKPLRQQLAVMLSDEKQHLSQFRSLYNGLDAGTEERLALSAIASSVLFEGGLMGAVRQGMLRDRESLLNFAAQAEDKAAETYRAFAQSCGDKQAADMLNGIAAEEDKHLQTLRDYF
ncbi:MAG: ferritin-like domain-containing protein [Clostridiales bacterium]|nr:ferritin-like domain-containing protein [Clostridiales bacterium]